MKRTNLAPVMVLVAALAVVLASGQNCYARFVGADTTTEPETSVPAKPTGLQITATAGSLNVEVDWDDVEGANRILGALAGGRAGQ